MKLDVEMTPNSLNSVLTGLNGASKKIERGLLAIGKAGGAKMQSYAQTNAKWTNRTGNARQTLKGDAKWVNKSELEVTVKHGVDYGVFLELSKQKRYAILNKSLQEVGPQILREFKKLCE